MAELRAIHDSLEALASDGLPDMALLLDPDVPPGAEFTSGDESVNGGLRLR